MGYGSIPGMAVLPVAQQRVDSVLPSLSEQWFGLQPAVRAYRFVVTVSVGDDHSHAQRHCRDLAVDEAANSVTSATTATMDRGRIFGITKGGLRLDIEALQ